MKNILKKTLPYTFIFSAVVVLCANYTFAQQPIVVEGVVPNVATKQDILNKLYVTYGQTNVIDKIQIRAVTAPNGWSTAVNHVISEDLKSIKQGKLSIKGMQVDLRGKVPKQEDIQITTNKVQSLLPVDYKLNAQLSVNTTEQQLIDATLKNRIVEFESGSAVLAPSGIQILDEMIVALQKVNAKKIKIIGHTDSSGDANKNLSLSQERARAVKNYLISKTIPAEILTAEGLGSTKPVADNLTADGRKKNRRIEFEVL